MDWVKIDVQSITVNKVLLRKSLKYFQNEGPIERFSKN